MTSHRLVVSPYLVVLLCLVALAPRARTRQTEQLDLVLAGGRVLDPETGLDATRNVGIREDRIAAVAVEPLEARDTLDVHGLVVAPGFIDLHAHGQDSESYRYYAHDGVTTALELEIGTYPVTPWYAAREGRSLINYGASVGHVGARRTLITHDESLPGAAAIGDKSRSWTHGALQDAELPRLDSLVERGLAEGALGVGFGIAYTPGASREEILQLFRVAARHGVPCFVHLREGGRDPATGGSVAALQEVITDAAATGAGLHVVHATSMGPGGRARCGGAGGPGAPGPPAARGHARPRAWALRARLRRAQSPGRGAQDAPAAGPTARASRAGNARQRSDPGGCGRRHHRVRPRARRGRGDLRAAGAVLAGDRPRAGERGVRGAGRGLGRRLFICWRLGERRVGVEG